MVLQTDTMIQESDSSKVVLINGILPSRSPLNKLVNWTKFWTNKGGTKPIDNTSDAADAGEQFPLEELGRHHFDKTKKRVSF